MTTNHPNMSSPNRPPKIPESVLVVIHTLDWRVLLLERADQPGFWQSVTGSRDTLVEPMFDVAVREVAEETGIVVADADANLNLATNRDVGVGADVKVGAGVVMGTAPHAPPGRGATVPRSALRDWGLSNIYEIYPVWRHRYAPGVTHNTEHVFGLMVPADTPVVLAPREHLAHGWWPWKEAADRCFSPSNAEAILQLPRMSGAGSTRP